MEVKRTNCSQTGMGENRSMLSVFRNILKTVPLLATVDLVRCGIRVVSRGMLVLYVPSYNRPQASFASWTSSGSVWMRLTFQLSKGVRLKC